MHALRAVTLNPALHYNLPLGAIEPGKKADLVKVKDLESFDVDEVYVGGRLVARGGVPLFAVRPKEMVNLLLLQRKVPSDFEIVATGQSVNARIIGLIKDEIITDSLVSELRVENGKVMPDVEKDILRVSVVNRYRDAPVSSAFVKGFGLRGGAIASSVAHDSHNIIAVGANSEDMAVAVNTLIQEGGGYCICSEGRCSTLNLRVAGLMCTKPASEVKRVLDGLFERARALGCTLEGPFMTMSFLSLLVVPKLKLGDKGLFDVEGFRFTDVVVS
jgi:adenine deaminase